MKKRMLPFCLLVLMSVMISSCVKDKIITTYTSYEPVYKEKAAVLREVKSSAATSLSQTGKLVLYGHYIFVNEVNKGVHVIDNSNPAAPRNIAFINIPGNIDLALKNNYLYADIYTDLLTIDVSDPANAVLKKVDYSVFPERQYGDMFNNDTSRYIIDWVKHETSEEVEMSSAKSNVESGDWLGVPVVMSNAGGGGFSAAAASVVGISGSMARFTIVGNYLYTVGRSALSAFNISSPANPQLEAVSAMGWNIETIYPLNDKLFIGSQTGMFVYSIANPSSPQQLSTFSHACFNDPVVANDHYAFITLRMMENADNDRGGIIMPPLCWNGPQRNQLDIVDISNILSPSMVKIYDMQEPMGMSLDGNHLFLCDGKGGLKLYNIDDVNNIRLVHHVTDIKPFDVIAYNNLAIVVSAEGISEFDYSNLNDIKKISSIAVTK